MDRVVGQDRLIDTYRQLRPVGGAVVDGLVDGQESGPVPARLRARGSVLVGCPAGEAGKPTLGSRPSLWATDPGHPAFDLGDHLSG
ncbi:hypothetical protein GCM10010260_83150 [Streptomyces filipinensis]|uniref:Uncharacterized protein n=1 Tax=Streptomyces filipinensis TaxID=66887 RepID=A0A918ILR7_9ACTN|nr:hypothetical protein GCM10010260_83150 [Streptomyces filipinensis]